MIGLNGKPKVQLFDGPIDRTSPRSVDVEALEKIRSREAVVGVVGLGYVGLPLARSFSRAGFRVLGFDLDAVKVHKLQNGRGYIASVPDETVVEMAGRGFAATDRFAKGVLKLRVDMSAVTYLDSTGVGAIIRLVKSAKALGRELRFSGVTGSPRKVLVMSNIITLLKEEPVGEKRP